MSWSIFIFCNWLFHKCKLLWGFSLWARYWNPYSLGRIYFSAARKCQKSDSFKELPYLEIDNLSTYNHFTERACHLISYSWKWNKYFPLGYLKICYWIIFKLWGNFTLCGVITQLAARCLNVNMGFQKLESISFDLLFVDKWSTSE